MLDARIPDGLTEVRSGWVLDDFVHAHQLLDELDMLDAKREAEARARASMRGRSG